MGEACDALAAACAAPPVALPSSELAGDARSTAPTIEATAQARKPCAVSRNWTSAVSRPIDFRRSRPARYPPNPDEIIAMTMKYSPVPISKLVEEAPRLSQGETTANPNPTPKERSSKVSAQAAAAPARMAPQLTPGVSIATDPFEASTSCAMRFPPALQGRMRGRTDGSILLGQAGLDVKDAESSQTPLGALGWWKARGSCRESRYGSDRSSV